MKQNSLIQIKKINKLKNNSWQGEVKFPDWRGYIDTTLALNSLYSFDGYKDQGKIYFRISTKVKSFDLFINNIKIDTSSIINGIYEINISKISINGRNTIQVTNIEPRDLQEAIIVNVPYPTIIDGTIEEVGLNKESFTLIEKIIESDIKNGYPSAQMAVIKDGKLVYQNTWGQINNYNKDGTRIKNGIKATNNTLYDIASNTKMYSVAYAIQYLVDNKKINLEDKIVDIIGPSFVNDTIEIKYASFADKYPGLKTIKEWKANITIKDVMMHRAGFSGSGHYHSTYFDNKNQKNSNKIKNELYVENGNKEETLKKGINRTPLMYKPRTNAIYSDIDYMILGLIIEKVTKKDLNTFLKETFWNPIGLKNITYQPLKHGFTKTDCASTELNGNTRDGIIDFPRIRKETITGEVHDEETYYMMEEVSGHAGLFANATDLAKLASVMLTGGYGNNRFFSKNTRDLFISPQSILTAQYGIGWWREGDNQRPFYYGPQSFSNTIGHQGWTGTLSMIDFANNMVIVLLTNSKNTPLVGDKNLDNFNDFAGNYYTTTSLGFVPQLIYVGMVNEPSSALKSLIIDMAREKQKAVLLKEEKIGKKLDENHPLKKAQKALEEIIK